MTVTICIRQNTFCQIFKESVSVKNSPRQNFALCGIYLTSPFMATELDS